MMAIAHITVGFEQAPISVEISVTDPPIAAITRSGHFALPVLIKLDHRINTTLLPRDSAVFISANVSFGKQEPP